MKVRIEDVKPGDVIRVAFGDEDNIVDVEVLEKELENGGFIPWYSLRIRYDDGREFAMGVNAGDFVELIDDNTPKYEVDENEKELYRRLREAATREMCERMSE